MAEFVVNGNSSSVTGMTPFFAHTAREPRTLAKASHFVISSLLAFFCMRKSSHHVSRTQPWLGTSPQPSLYPYLGSLALPLPDYVLPPLPPDRGLDSFVHVDCISLPSFSTLSTIFPDALVKVAPLSSLPLPFSAATSAISFSTPPR
jgi:hypothetical protein